jgi:hypothetical protein
MQVIRVHITQDHRCHAHAAKKECDHASEMIKIARLSSTIPVRIQVGVKEFWRSIGSVPGIVAVIPRRDSTSDRRAAKIRDFGDSTVKNQDVGRLQVLMRDFGRMELVKASGDVVQAPKNPNCIERAAKCQMAANVPVGLLKDEIVDDAEKTSFNTDLAVLEAMTTRSMRLSLHSFRRLRSKLYACTRICRADGMSMPCSAAIVSAHE